MMLSQPCPLSDHHHHHTGMNEEKENTPCSSSSSSFSPSLFVLIDPSSKNEEVNVKMLDNDNHHHHAPKRRKRMVEQHYCNTKDGRATLHPLPKWRLQPRRSIPTSTNTHFNSYYNRHPTTTNDTIMSPLPVTTPTVLLKQQQKPALVPTTISSFNHVQSSPNETAKEKKCDCYKTPPLQLQEQPVSMKMMTTTPQPLSSSSQPYTSYNSTYSPPPIAIANRKIVTLKPTTSTATETAIKKENLNTTPITTPLSSSPRLVVLPSIGGETLQQQQRQKPYLNLNFENDSSSRPPATTTTTTTTKRINITLLPRPRQSRCNYYDFTF